MLRLEIEVNWNEGIDPDTQTTLLVFFFIIDDKMMII
jgi:hypothetical protein